MAELLDSEMQGFWDEVIWFLLKLIVQCFPLEMELNVPVTGFN